MKTIGLFGGIAGSILGIVVYGMTENPYLLLIICLWWAIWLIQEY